MTLVQAVLMNTSKWPISFLVRINQRECTSVYGIVGPDCVRILPVKRLESLMAKGSLERISNQSHVHHCPARYGKRLGRQGAVIPKPTILCTSRQSAKND